MAYVRYSGISPVRRLESDSLRILLFELELLDHESREILRLEFESWAID